VIALSFPICPAGDGMGDARSLCAHAGDRLRAQVFFFQVAVRNLLLRRDSILPLSASFIGPFIPANGFPILLGCLCVGVQDEIGPRHGIID